jgi:hypothetical protein
MVYSMLRNGISNESLFALLDVKLASDDEQISIARRSSHQSSEPGKC